MHSKSSESLLWDCDVSCRQLSRSEIDAFEAYITDWFKDHVRMRPKYEWYRAVDTALVAERIRNGSVRHLLIDETYVLVYDVGSPWYSREVMIEEMLVVRLATGTGTIDGVVSVLVALAAVHGAQGIAAGNSLARYPRALERLYTRRGFQASGTTFYRRT